MKYILCLLVLLECQCLTGQSEELYQEIDKIIRYDTEITYPLEKSFIVGIIYEDTTYIVNFGPTHIDTFDLFEVGGLTKVFTSILATKLASNELIDLDAPINHYLPTQWKNKNLSQYTVSDLMMHQIKFPKRPSDLSRKEYNISNPYAYYTKVDLLTYYSTFQEPLMGGWLNKTVDYSHINYALLEVIIEQKMKMPLEDLFQLYLFQELGMLQTSLDFTKEALAMGFDRSNMIPEPWEYASFAGSEGLITCMYDLLKFVKLSMESPEDYILTSQQIKEDSKITRNLYHTGTWYIMKSRKAGDIYTHSGVTERHKAYVHFKKDSKTGVVILCQSSIGVENLGLLILRMINNNWKK
ncbi:serine hydrolase domain-containing protein [Portibacter marinus]|uniref:serine hydrolase domain-containing protein n=1 Tax=Portibacter marinus TaxID=2898660 RepID=UPI001F1BC71E|nr:serine hydrolase [Portibacter marinus]